MNEREIRTELLDRMCWNESMMQTRTSQGIQHCTPIAAAWIRDTAARNNEIIRSLTLQLESIERNRRTRNAKGKASQEVSPVVHDGVEAA